MASLEFEIGFFTEPTTLDEFLIKQGMERESDTEAATNYVGQETSAEAFYIRAPPMEEDAEPDWTKAPKPVVSTLHLQADFEHDMALINLRDAILNKFDGCYYDENARTFWTGVDYK
jgi:hypothetical protein